ncbi:MAG: GTPase Era [Betaproteobacteria bacterium]|jgi:GTP-binding protein Era|uniref:GTPase Era n=1 Tax=unclassified Thiomonas TaxID=2625466 RepID=UPI000BD97445|nr:MULTISPECIES: GTPase Era [unclassified Thiomonas]MDE2174793.1 GTPase Era [Betaproteobacteria bacterium]MDE2268122.1 GTPase Era [Betaproteobacteria bacterium]OZB71742.1 MAG: GTPase Era [Thiomonas sp. 13-64-67]
MTSSPPDSPRRFGTVAIVGRPNVGKSTLLNALVRAKVSITSHKAQTTRHRILGVTTHGASQFAFVDTPGFQTQHMHALNRAMNRTVTGALSEVDLVLWVLEAGKILPQDRTVLEVLPDDRPVIAVVNKLDRITPREKLLPWLAELGQLRKFAEIVPMSAQKKADAPRLLSIMEPYLHEGEWGYEEDALTDRSERFLAAEILREKLFRLTGDELPYTSTVVIEQFAQEGDLRRISAAIIVDRDGHKAMVIGAGGERLKRISTEARQDMQVLFDGPVFLEVWVKTRSGWADDQAAVRAFGYED